MITLTVEQLDSLKNELGNKEQQSKIEAIKAFRRITGCSLRDSKLAVDALENGEPIPTEVGVDVDSDLRKFLEMYKGFGIELEADKFDSRRIVITMKARSHKKLPGQEGLKTMVMFDRDGNFLEQYICE